MSALDARKAEEFVVAACLASPRTYWQVAGRLQSRMFGDPWLREAFAAIEGLAAEKKDPRVDLVARRMSEDEERDHRALLLAIVAGVGDDIHLVDTFAAEIVDAFQRREVKRLAKEIAKRALDINEQPTALLAYAEAGIADIAAAEGGGRESFGSIAARVADQVYTAFERREVPGFDWGLKTLDEVLGPMRPALYFLGGDPGAGKTALAAQIAQYHAERGRCVAFFALDQEQEDIVARMLAARVGTTTRKLLSAQVDQVTLERLYEVVAWTRTLRLEVFTGAFTMQQITQVCAGLRATAALDLVVIDHLREIVGAGGKSISALEHAERHCHGLKALKTDLKIPVICLAHRKVEARSREDPTPAEGDLWGGGGPERTADAILNIWLPARNMQWRRMMEAKGRKEGDPDPDRRWRVMLGKSEIIVTKNRHGEVPQRRLLRFDGDTMTYEDIVDGSSQEEIPF